MVYHNLKGLRGPTTLLLLLLLLTLAVGASSAPVTSNRAVHAETETCSVIAAVVVIAATRATYLERSLQSLRLHCEGEPCTSKFPLFISQDGNQEDVARTVSSFSDIIHEHIQWELDSGQRRVKDEPSLPAKHRRPNRRDSDHDDLLATVKRIKKKLRIPRHQIERPIDSYKRIAKHYEQILRELFDTRGYDRVVILEDDMEVAPDFFEYFEAMAPLLDNDSTLLCASSWNDNGRRGLVSDPAALYRTEFFPGLGWMLKKGIWDTLKGSWPDAWWDDWLREPENRAGRECIRPEISRTYNFGAVGVSNGQFYEEYLSDIHLNTDFVPFTSMNISHLWPESYAEIIAHALDHAEVTDISHLKERQLLELEKGTMRMKFDHFDDYSFEEMLQNAPKFLVRYDETTAESFALVANTLGLFPQPKAGIYRTSWRGIVIFRVAGAIVFVAPSSRVTLM